MIRVDMAGHVMPKIDRKRAVRALESGFHAMIWFVPLNSPLIFGSKFTVWAVEKFLWFVFPLFNWNFKLNLVLKIWGKKRY